MSLMVIITTLEANQNNMGMESFSSGNNQESEVPPMEGFLKYESDKGHWSDMDRIDERITAIRNGEAKTREGSVISGTDAPEEIARLEGLKVQFKEAASKGIISKDLFEQRYSF